MTELTNDRLDSWKEIADYLGRDVRTVIRWEKEKGLPVHRVPGGKRQGVFAYKSEIDQWMLGEGDARSAEPSAENAPAAEPPREGLHASRAIWLRLAIPSVTAGLLLIAAALLWMDRPPSAASGPLPLQRPLQFARADYEVSAPRGIAAGDFNGDKKIDIALADSLHGQVVILLGDGYGTFPRRVVSRSALKSPEHIAIGDFNGDGRLDIALSPCFGDSEIEVLLGDGHGAFRSGFRHDVGGRSRWIAAGDLNRDGKLDLVVAASNAERMIVFLGNGDGTFRESARYEAERDVAALALVDLNGDGALDIVADDYRSAFGKSVSVYLNAGDGTFSARETFAAGDGPLGLAVADLNNDGKPDVVTANFPLKGSLLFGQGAGRFAEAQSFDAGRGNGYVEIADLDRDAALDLLILGEHSNTASIFLGDGHGAFRLATNIPTGNYPDGVVVADFDGDRKPDLAIFNMTGNSVSIFLNRTGEVAASRRWLTRLTSFWTD